MIAARDAPGVGRRQMPRDAAARGQVAQLALFIGREIDGVHLRLVFAGVAEVLHPVHREAAVRFIRHALQLARLHVRAVAAAVPASLSRPPVEVKEFVVRGEILAGKVQLGVSLRAEGVLPNLISGNGVDIPLHCLLPFKAASFRPPPRTPARRRSREASRRARSDCAQIRCPPQTANA